MKDRLPPMDPAGMSEAQRKAAAELIAGPRKAVIGPFIPLLRSPELMDRMQRVGEYLRFGTSVPAKLNELAILVTARHVTNQFEWVVHHPHAIKAGVAPTALDALARGERPRGLPDDEAVVVDFCRELLSTHQVRDETFARAVALLGEQGVVDLMGTVGYFFAICVMMNAAGTPPPKSEVPLLQPLAAAR